MSTVASRTDSAILKEVRDNSTLMAEDCVSDFFAMSTPSYLKYRAANTAGNCYNKAMRAISLHHLRLGGPIR